MTKKMAGVCSLAALGLFISLPGGARAADLILNGGFEDTTPAGTSGYIGHNGYTVANWSTTGYNFIFAPGTADTTGAGTAHLTLWGLHNGGPDAITVSPNGGGNFLAADGAYEVGAITQDISGLTIGHTYQVGFDYAGAQQEGASYNTATTEAWKVSLGGANEQETTVLNNVVHGFTGWSSTTFNYVATSTSETLSFLAAGTPDGKPPFVLLDGVTMNDVSGTDVPEPTALVAMFAGVLGAGVFVRRRARTTKSATKPAA